MWKNPFLVSSSSLICNLTILFVVYRYTKTQRKNIFLDIKIIEFYKETYELIKSIS